MYLIRLYVQVRACALEEPVPTLRCANSAYGRFSSRHPPPPNRASTGMRQRVRTEKIGPSSFFARRFFLGFGSFVVAVQVDRIRLIVVTFLERFDPLPCYRYRHSRAVEFRLLPRKARTTSLQTSALPGAGCRGCCRRLAPSRLPRSSLAEAGVFCRTGHCSLSSPSEASPRLAPRPPVFARAAVCVPPIVPPSSSRLSCPLLPTRRSSVPST